MAGQVLRVALRAGIAENPVRAVTQARGGDVPQDRPSRGVAVRVFAFAILLLVAGGKGALAGTLIETEARGLGSDPLPSRRGVMHLEPDRMRLDVPEVSSAIIYRGDLDLVWIVDHRDRSFVRIDRATMDELSRRMAEAKAELRARLAAMSPELRAAMERMLGKTTEPVSFQVLRVAGG